MSWTTVVIMSARRLVVHCAATNRVNKLRYVRVVEVEDAKLMCITYDWHAPVGEPGPACCSR